MRQSSIPGTPRARCARVHAMIRSFNRITPRLRPRRVRPAGDMPPPRRSPRPPRPGAAAARDVRRGAGVADPQRAGARPLRPRRPPLRRHDDSLRDDVMIEIAGDRIERVEPAQAHAPSGADVIDLSRDTVLPGLIDCHVHLAIRADRYEDIYHFKDTPFDVGVLRRGPRAADPRRRLHHGARRRLASVPRGRSPERRSTTGTSPARASSRAGRSSASPVATAT